MNEKNIVTSEELVEKVLHYIREKKGEDIVVLDLRKISSVSDFFIIVSGSSGPQNRAIADEIRVKLKKEDNILPWHCEGYESQKWILLDFVDVVVHVFDNETRQYYGLENLWDDAETRKIKEQA